MQIKERGGLACASISPPDPSPSLDDKLLALIFQLTPRQRSHKDEGRGEESWVSVENSATLSASVSVRHFLRSVSEEGGPVDLLKSRQEVGQVREAGLGGRSMGTLLRNAVLELRPLLLQERGPLGSDECEKPLQTMQPFVLRANFLSC